MDEQDSINLAYKANQDAEEIMSLIEESNIEHKYDLIDPSKIPKEKNNKEFFNHMDTFLEKPTIRMFLRLVIDYIVDWVTNTINFSMYYMANRMLMVYLGFCANTDSIIGATYARAITNLFSDRVLISVVTSTNVEVGKSLGEKKYDHLPKVLISCMCISTTYLILIFFPICFFSDYILTEITDLKPGIITMTREVLLFLYIPCYVLQMSFCMNSYVQSLGGNRIISRYNIANTIISLCAFIASTQYFDNPIYRFVTFFISFAFFQIITLFYVYLFVLGKDGRPKKFEFEPKTLYSVLKMLASNTSIDIFDLLEAEFLMVLATFWMNSDNSSAFSYGLVLRFVIGTIVYNGFRQPYTILNQFLGKFQERKSKKSFYLSLVVGFVLSYIIISPIIIWCKPIAHYSFRRNPVISNILVDIIFLLACVSPLKLMSRFMVDCYKALGKRLYALFITLSINYILGPCMCYYWTHYNNIGAMGFTYSFFIQKFLEFVVYLTFLTIFDWKEANRNTKRIKTN